MRPEARRRFSHQLPQLTEGDYLVACGSLSLGMPLDILRTNQQNCFQDQGKINTRHISGSHNRNGQTRSLFDKTPLGELATLCRVSSISAMNVEAGVMKCLKMYPVDVLVVSLGAKGALMGASNQIQHLSASMVHQQSTIGAGDSMVRKIVYGLSKNKNFRGNP